LLIWLALAAATTPSALKTVFSVLIFSRSGGNNTVVGTSKGAAIAVLFSHLLENNKVNFVLLGACHPDTVDEFMKDQVCQLR